MKIYSFNELVENKELKDIDMALTIGVFDSMHLGHQRLLTSLLDYKEKNPNTKTMVITFNSNPKHNRAKDIDTIRLREKYINNFGIDYLVLIDFSSQFSKTSGVEFIRLLHTFCRIKLVVVGEDFKCGNIENRVTADDLVHTLELLHSSASVEIIKNVLSDDNDRISSTKISELLQIGRLEEVTNLLGKYYEIDLLNLPIKIFHDSLIIDMRDSSQQSLINANYKALLHFIDSSVIECNISSLNGEIKILDYKGKLDGFSTIEVISII